MVEQRSPKPTVGSSNLSAPATSFLSFFTLHWQPPNKVNYFRMQSHLADIFAIQPVRLRAAYRAHDTQPLDGEQTQDSQPLSGPLAEDILRLLPTGSEVHLGDVSTPQLQGNRVYLPSDNLSVAHKQALWQQLCECEQVLIDA